MYIPPFWVGVLATVILEIALLVGYAIFSKPRR